MSACLANGITSVIHHCGHLITHSFEPPRDVEADDILIFDHEDPGLMSGGATHLSSLFLGLLGYSD